MPGGKENTMSDTNGAQPSALSNLASIIIPCCGMLEYTKLLVPSLLEHTRQPYELIFMDIGSLDGTAEYLAGLAAGVRHCRVTVVRAESDLGIPEACREALGTASGEYVVLLNNDTIVTEHWLNKLSGAADSLRVALVGPMSNYAAPPQLVEVVPYRLAVSNQGSAGNGWSEANGRRGHSGSLTADRCSLTALAAVNSFAKDRQEKHAGKWLQVERLGGFCLLMTRAVLNKLGSSVNEWSDLGLFDTDILSAKAREAGFALAVCRDVFIHHFGTRTFAHGGGKAAADIH